MLVNRSTTTPEMTIDEIVNFPSSELDRIAFKVVARWFNYLIDHKFVFSWYKPWERPVDRSEAIEKMTKSVESIVRGEIRHYSKRKSGDIPRRFEQMLYYAKTQIEPFIEAKVQVETNTNRIFTDNWVGYLLGLGIFGGIGAATAHISYNEETGLSNVIIGGVITTLGFLMFHNDILAKTRQPFYKHISDVNKNLKEFFYR